MPAFQPLPIRRAGAPKHTYASPSRLRRSLEPRCPSMHSRVGLLFVDTLLCPCVPYRPCSTLQLLCMHTGPVFQAPVKLVCSSECSLIMFTFQSLEKSGKTTVVAWRSWLSAGRNSIYLGLADLYLLSDFPPAVHQFAVRWRGRPVVWAYGPVQPAIAIG